MVAFADRDMAVDVVDRDRFECFAQCLGVGALRLVNPGGEDLQRLPLLPLVIVGRGTVLALDRDRDRARGRVVVLFLRGCSNRPLDFS
jgi:hypothetical protein